jgi:hypothetical protein
LVGGPTRRWVAARAASRWVRISGMTCSVLPILDCQPHWQLACRWPRSGRAAGLTVTLCPATCSLTEMVTGHLRSVGDGRTYPRGKPVTNCPLGSRRAVHPGGHSPPPSRRLPRSTRPAAGGSSVSYDSFGSDADAMDGGWPRPIVRRRVAGVGRRGKGGDAGPDAGRRVQTAVTSSACVRLARTARPPTGAGWPGPARRGAPPTRRTQTTAGCRTPGGRTPRRAGWPCGRW